MPARSSLPPLLSCQLYYHLGREPRHLRTYAVGASGTGFPGSSFPNRSESFTENKSISTIRLGRTYLPATTRGSHRSNGLRLSRSQPAKRRGSLTRICFEASRSVARPSGGCP